MLHIRACRFLSNCCINALKDINRNSSATPCKITVMNLFPSHGMGTHKFLLVFPVPGNSSPKVLPPNAGQTLCSHPVLKPHRHYPNHERGALHAAIRAAGPFQNGGGNFTGRSLETFKAPSVGKVGVLGGRTGERSGSPPFRCWAGV